MSLPLPRSHCESVRARAAVAVSVIGLVVTACGTGEPSGTPIRPTSTTADVLVTPLTQTTDQPTPCRWIEVTSDNGHALPSELAAAAGRVEHRSCGAPEGDTTGLGGPVEWRVVPTP